MTERQWSLFRLLNSQPDKWFTQKEICEQVKGYEFNDRPNDKCPSIRTDKLAINASEEVDKIIVMNNYCFKIGTEAEYRLERRKHVLRLKNQKKEIENMDFKYSKDKQGRLLTSGGEIIDEKSKARKFFETFTEEEY